MIAFNLLWLALLSAPGDSADLLPANVGQAFANPEDGFILRWKVRPGQTPKSEDYRLRDYEGKVVSQGRLKPMDRDTMEASVHTLQGYFEIELAASGQRSGLICLPAWNGARDPFFAIDAALSWLEPDHGRRIGLIKAADRCGIATMRERLSWASVNPERGRWEWEGSSRYDSIRGLYREVGMPILEMAHDSPLWLGHVGKYPRDLLAAGESWAEVGRRWQGQWAGLEVWNEPDIFFGGDLPADQYVALAKAIGWALSRQKASFPLIGGVMALPNAQFLKTIGRSQLLDRVDAFSFHTYATAPELEELTAGYREWLVRNGHGGLPLWLTECGRPWTKGPERPPLDQDQKSALDIAMKGVESKACGIARYFPFVFPYFEENTNNFGMMSRSATPLRALAAYAQLIRVLGNQAFQGDLPEQPGILRARLFGDGHQVIAVFYTGRIDPGASITPGVPVKRVEGIDGRLLAARKDGSIPIPDGLCYAWLDPSGLGGKVAMRPATRRARPTLQDPTAGHASASPIVLRFGMDESRFRPSAQGYRVIAAPAGALRLAVDVWNLGDKPFKGEVGLRLESGKDGADQPMLVLQVPPRSSRPLEWEVDLARWFASSTRVSALLTARQGGDVRDRLCVVLFGESDLSATLAASGHVEPLPIGEPARWRPFQSPGGTMVMDSPQGKGWRLRFAQETGDRWAYPQLELPDTTHLQGRRGLIVRARCQGEATSRVILWEGEANIGYLTEASIIPADGRWHVARIEFKELVVSNANAPDPNHRLDLDRVRRISLGMNQRSREAMMEVSDLCVYGSTK
jgi:hypothetical protein